MGPHEDLMSLLRWSWITFRALRTCRLLTRRPDLAAEVAVQGVDPVLEGREQSFGVVVWCLVRGGLESCGADQGQAGSAMMRRQARSSTRTTGRQELLDIGSRACHVPASAADLTESSYPRRSRACWNGGLLERLAEVPDPRGVRHRPAVVLALTACAV